jgi:hypothetical protein
MSASLSEMIPKLILESMDGSISIPLDGSTGWVRMPGATGLEMPPSTVVADRIPGMPGAMVTDVQIHSRPIFIPIYGRLDNGQASYRQMLDQIRSLMDPLNGSFRLVGASVRGFRELVVTYDSGLEGNDGADLEGLSWCKVGLKVTAHEPYAQALEDRRLEFRVVAGTPEPFLGVTGGTDAPWPRSMSNSAVVGSNMSTTVYSELPVYPKLELVGPMTAFDGTLSPTITRLDGTVAVVAGREWSVEVPNGVPGGATLVLVTDPRERSIRMNGTLAAGLVSRGSTLRPFYPGTNVLSVTAPGGTEETLIVLSWREKFRSLW